MTVVVGCHVWWWVSWQNTLYECGCMVVGIIPHSRVVGACRRPATNHAAADTPNLGSGNARGLIVVIPVWGTVRRAPHAPRVRG